MDLGQQTLSVEVWTPSEAGVGRDRGTSVGHVESGRPESVWCAHEPALLSPGSHAGHPVPIPVNHQSRSR